MFYIIKLENGMILFNNKSMNSIKELTQTLIKWIVLSIIIGIGVGIVAAALQ